MPANNYVLQGSSENKSEHSITLVVEGGAITCQTFAILFFLHATIATWRMQSFEPNNYDIYDSKVTQIPRPLMPFKGSTPLEDPHTYRGIDTVANLTDPSETCAAIATATPRWMLADQNSGIQKFVTAQVCPLLVFANASLRVRLP